MTYAIEFVFYAFAVHTAIQFASGLVSLWNSEKSAPASVLAESSECKWDEERLAELYAEASEDEGFLEEIQEPVAPQSVLVDCVVPFVRPAKSTTVADLLQPKSIRQLKKIASAVRLPKYCNDPKPRLIARLLSEVDAARLQEVIAG